MTIDYANFSSVLHSVRTSSPASHHFQLEFNKFSIDIFVNSEQLYKTLKNYFSEFISHSPKDNSNTTLTVHDTAPLVLPYTFQLAIPPAHKKIKHEWVNIHNGRIVRNRITHMTYLVGETQNAIAGPCLAKKNQVVNFINSRFINHKVNQGYLLGHGAGVTAQNRGMIISGNSGAGKSTLALHMLTSGANFVSNDRVLINNHGNDPFFGTLQHPRINPGTALNNPQLEKVITPHDRVHFRRMSTEALWQLENKYDALIPECFGTNRFTPHAPLSAVAILDWHRGAAPMRITHVNLADSSNYLSMMMKKNDRLYLPDHRGYTDPSIREYISALGDTPVFVIQGGVDFAGATDKLLGYLHTGIMDI